MLQKLLLKSGQVGLKSLKAETFYRWIYWCDSILPGVPFGWSRGSV